MLTNDNPSCDPLVAGVFTYHLRIKIRETKEEEFTAFLSSISEEYRNEIGCLQVDLYRDMERTHNFGLISAWQSRKAMDEHFKRKNFSLIVGAARVLGENYELVIGEVSGKRNL